MAVKGVNMAKLPQSPNNPWRVQGATLSHINASVNAEKTIDVNARFWDALDQRRLFEARKNSHEWNQLLGMALSNAMLQYIEYKHYSIHPMWIYSMRLS